MHYYVSTIMGSGTRAAPYRPLGSVGAPSPWAMIDLRPSGTMASGVCLLALSVRNDLAGMEYLGEDFTATPSAAARDRIANKLGLTFNHDGNYADLIRQLLHPAEGLADNVRWKPIVLTLQKRWQAFICGQLIFDEAAVGGGLGSDDFNRANETPLTSPWVRLSGGAGNINLASNAITASAQGEKFYYYSGAASLPAQFSQLRRTGAVTNDDWGPAVRIGSNGFSGYWFSPGGDPAGDVCFTAKIDAGAFTLIENFADVTINNNDIFRLEASGSTLTSKENGAEISGSPSTDTGLTTAGNGVGVFLYDTGGSLDDFLGGNLADLAEQRGTARIFQPAQYGFAS